MHSQSNLNQCQLPNSPNSYGKSPHTGGNLRTETGESELLRKPPLEQRSSGQTNDGRNDQGLRNDQVVEPVNPNGVPYYIADRFQLHHCLVNQSLKTSLIPGNSGLEISGVKSGH